MGNEVLILTGLGLIFGLYMAWNIGANDVANAMGTSVGSGALTLRRAVILAAVMEFGGAFLVGPHVSETVRKGIVDPALFASEPMILVLGMLAALLAAGVWLQIATYFGWPVSTTHSIVGSIVGFGVAYGGLEAVHWGKVGQIALSWLVSPTLAGLIAFGLFRFILAVIFYQPDPIRAAKRATPFIAAAVMITMMLVLTFKGLKPFWNNLGYGHLDPLPVTLGLAGAAVLGLLGGMVSAHLVGRIAPQEADIMQQSRNLYLRRSLTKAIMHLRRVCHAADGATRRGAEVALHQTEEVHRHLHDEAQFERRGSLHAPVEKIFVYLQIISAGFVAFAHGANDVANAVGPLSVVLETATSVPMAVPETTDVRFWVLALGGAGIVVGLATWGWRVIRTIGERITELTPSRGFCAEFAAALTILTASVYKLPISTTHTLVGAVIGVGLARGLGALNMRMVRDIVISWLITIPTGAGLAILFFAGLRAIFT